jgi:hypothetical protein
MSSKIKLLTVFTESHKVFLDSFIKTFPFDTDIELIIKYMPQECKLGKYYTEGWDKTTKNKLQLIADTLNEMGKNDILIYSDIDVIFIKPFKEYLLEELNGHDIVFQEDRGDACTGFFCCRANETVKSLLQGAINLIQQKKDDQATTNYMLKTKLVDNISYKLLSHKIYNCGFIPKWNPQKDIQKQYDSFPNDILVFHANWTVGIENKLILICLAHENFGMNW